MHKRRAFQASSPNYQAASLWAAFFYPKQSRRLDLNDVIRLPSGDAVAARDGSRRVAVGCDSQDVAMPLVSPAGAGIGDGEGTLARRARADHGAAALRERRNLVFPAAVGLAGSAARIRDSNPARCPARSGYRW